MNEVTRKVAESLRPLLVENSGARAQLPSNLQETYRRFITFCDGGYTNDSFFHFFGKHGPPAHNLTSWNEPGFWKHYFGLDETVFVFAEDIFGTQFCFDVRGTRRVVKMFIPDGGKTSLCANTFEEFLEREILSDRTNNEVRELASRFFNVSGERFRPLMHISCKIPRILGGIDTDLNNLQLIDAVVDLKILGQITMQVRALPPGTKIRDIRVNNQNMEVKLIV